MKRFFYNFLKSENVTFFNSLCFPNVSGGVFLTASSTAKSQLELIQSKIHRRNLIQLYPEHDSLRKENFNIQGNNDTFFRKYV